jgi:Icc-related predicted phosphoesterase
MAGWVLLHVSDAHCATEKLRRILEEAPSVDVVVASGDFECLDTAEALLGHAKAPIVAVTGNMDDASIAKRLREAGVLIEGTYKRVTGILFAGVGGRDPASSLEALKSKPRPEDPGPLVLVTHHPPKGFVDRSFIGVHAGLKEIRSLLDELKPIAHLCGHIHEARGTAIYGSTLIVNPGPAKRGYYAIVELDASGARARLEKL